MHVVIRFLSGFCGVQIQFMVLSVVNEREGVYVLFVLFLFMVVFSQEVQGLFEAYTLKLY